MHYPHMLAMLLLISPLTTHTRDIPTSDTDKNMPHYKTTTPEDKAATQVAAAGFLGLAENIVNIIQNSDNPKELSSSAHGIISNFLNIIAATKCTATKTPECNLEIEFLKKLKAAINKQLILKTNSDTDSNN